MRAIFLESDHGSRQLKCIIVESRQTCRAVFYSQVNADIATGLTHEAFLNLAFGDYIQLRSMHSWQTQAYLLMFAHARLNFLNIYALLLAIYITKTLSTY